MTRKLSIFLLLIYTGILFGHGVISAGHSILHMTSEIIALHSHGHHHDVADHGEVFNQPTDNEINKSAHFNMLSLVFFYQSPDKNHSEHLVSNVQQKNYQYLLVKSRIDTPPTPPPIG